MMLVVVMATFGMMAFASNERPLVLKPYYYTVVTGIQVCNFWDDYTSCYYECTSTTYSVNQWNQVTMIGSTTYESPTRCPGASLRSGNNGKSSQDIIREEILQQQRSLPGNENVVLKFLNL